MILPANPKHNQAKGEILRKIDMFAHYSSKRQELSKRMIEEHFPVQQLSQMMLMRLSQCDQNIIMCNRKNLSKRLAALNSQNFAM